MILLYVNKGPADSAGPFKVKTFIELIPEKVFFNCRTQIMIDRQMIFLNLEGFGLGDFYCAIRNL